MPDQPDNHTRLGDQHYGVSLTAARSYAEHERIEDEREAKAELERILADAYQSPTHPDRWRLRSRLTGLDITVQTTYDEERGHRVVTRIVSIRDAKPAAAQRPSYQRRQDLRHGRVRETVSESGAAAPLDTSSAPAAKAAPATSAAPDLRVHLARDHREQALCGAPRDSGRRLIPLTLDRFVAPQLEQLDRIVAASRGTSDLAELGLLVRAILEEPTPHRCPICWRLVLHRLESPA